MSDAFTTTQGSVTELGQTKNGKPKLKIGGQWYFMGKALNGALPSVGQTVELRYSLFGDRGDLRGLEAWKPATTAQPTKTTVEANTGLDEASLRFISNVVGSAITAKTLIEPFEILPWFTAAKLALNGKAYTPDGPVPGVDDQNGFDDDTYGGLDDDDTYGDLPPF